MLHTYDLATHTSIWKAQIATLAFYSATLCKQRLSTAVLCYRYQPPTPPLVAKLTSTMPPKRKNVDTHSPNPRPDAPRRSNRRTKDTAETQDRHPIRDTGIIVRKRNYDGRTDDDGDGDGVESVDRVMQDLSDMEKRFQNALRRQRLDVESSDLGGDKVALKPEVVQEQPLKAAKAVINETVKVQTDKAQTDKASSDDREVDQATGDAPVEDEEVAERGAKRPPPVNSPILPLPWTGRLGYVRFSTSSCRDTPRTIPS